VVLVPLEEKKSQSGEVFLIFLRFYIKLSDILATKKIISIVINTKHIIKRGHYLLLLMGLVQQVGWAQVPLRFNEALKHSDTVQRVEVYGSVPSEIKRLKRLKYLMIAGSIKDLKVSGELFELDSLRKVYLRLWGREHYRLPRALAQMKSLKEITVAPGGAINLLYPKEIKQRKDLRIADDNRVTYLRMVIGYQQGIWPVTELGLVMRRQNPAVDHGAMNSLVQFNPMYWSWSIIWEKYLTRGVEGYRFMVGNSFLKLGSIYYNYSDTDANNAKRDFLAYRIELGINADQVDLNLGYNIAPGHQEINRLIFNLRINLAVLLLKKRKYY